MLKYTISLDLLIKYDFIDETLNKLMPIVATAKSLKNC